MKILLKSIKFKNANTTGRVKFHGTHKLELTCLPVSQGDSQTAVSQSVSQPATHSSRSRRKK